MCVCVLLCCESWGVVEANGCVCVIACNTEPHEPSLFVKMKNLMMRSQLDCCDPDMSGERKVFDLKTRYHTYCLSLTHFCVDSNELCVVICRMCCVQCHSPDPFGLQ